MSSPPDPDAVPNDVAKEPQVVDADVVLRHVLTARVRRLDGALYIGLGDDALRLDDTATDLFLAVDGRLSIRALGAAVAAEYDANPDEVTDDAIALFVQLVGLGLLDPVAPGAPHRR